jgi:hypothetical protein
MRFMAPPCCAPAATGNIVAPSPAINSRRLISALQRLYGRLSRSGFHGNGAR